MEGVQGGDFGLKGGDSGMEGLGLGLQRLKVGGRLGDDGLERLREAFRKAAEKGVFFWIWWDRGCNLR